jgi:hypothetical protein
MKSNSIRTTSRRVRGVWVWRRRNYFKLFEYMLGVEICRVEPGGRAERVPAREDVTALGG